MKGIKFRVILLLLLLIGGGICCKRSELKEFFIVHAPTDEEEVLSARGIETPQQIFSGISIKAMNDLGLTGEQAVDAYLMENLPRCHFPELKTNGKPIVIDEVVKNCKKIPKVGRVPDGLGGACYPSFAYDSVGDRVLEMNARECIYGINPAEYLARGVNPSYLCLDPQTPERDWDEIWELAPEQRPEPDGKPWKAPYSLLALQKALKSGLLSKAVPPYYNTPGLFCAENDPDCETTYDIGSRSDTQGNYFVAGERTDLPDKKLYAINDQLYLPWEGSRGFSSENGELSGQRTTPWFFGGIKEGNLIVKRMVDMTPNEKLIPGGRMEANYTLETCEIDL